MQPVRLFKKGSRVRVSDHFLPQNASESPEGGEREAVQLAPVRRGRGAVHTPRLDLRRARRPSLKPKVPRYFVFF